ncbi:hypothetical protein BD626DRAFT_446325 [Schizophyllum amplum]|uniref:Uncharacterized protein n=1 Tax=Schizophyllum amplum TaxID=97359 RepID=A0A550CVH5_9AGAR|nr:hypothetical protein BD626DRAFT_446325 [Auriculariopsis ampla]
MSSTQDIEITLAPGVGAYTAGGQADEFQALRTLPSQDDVLNDLYILCENGRVLKGFIEMQVWPLMRQLFDENPVVQNYHTHVNAIGELLENIAMLFSKLFEIHRARGWYWGLPECAGDDRWFLYFTSSLDRVHHILRKALRATVKYPHVLEHYRPSDYPLLEQIKALYTKLADLDRKIFKWVSVVEENDIKRKIRWKERERGKRLEQQSHRDEAYGTLCRNEKRQERADSLHCLRERMEQSQKTRQVYKQM